jgi:hypothetical protein
MLYRFLRSFLILAFLFVFPSVVFAQAAVYYDYSPDPWRSERFAGNTISTLEQVFQPRDNIVLEGFDF